LTKPTIAVIDGDEIAFVIAAACEERSIEVTNSLSEEKGNFKNRTQLKKFLQGLEVPEDHFKVDDIQTPDELANALHSVKVTMDSIKQACKADKIEVYISGKDNFRDKLPLPKQYKGNRKDTLKPVLLPDIRAYLVKKYNAKIVDGVEVDDKCCYRMWDGYKANQKIIGVTTDKDACGNMGWLYNRDKMTEPEFIDGLGELHIDSKGKIRGKGRKWGYLQWLIGDSTDHYNPCDICGVRYGEKSAYKLLEPLTTDKECIQAVYNQYKEWYPEKIISYTDWEGNTQQKSLIEIMQMYMDCYRMRRFENDVVNVEDVLIKMEIIF
jgi:hypothetical protein